MWLTGTLTSRDSLPHAAGEVLWQKTPTRDKAPVCVACICLWGKHTYSVTLLLPAALLTLVVSQTPDSASLQYLSGLQFWRAEWSDPDSLCEFSLREPVLQLWEHALLNNISEWSRQAFKLSLSFLLCEAIPLSLPFFCISPLVHPESCLLSAVMK